MTEASCPLCQPLNENLLWRDAILRIIRVDDADYPGFCRVILNRHVKEMTDLPPGERARLMQAVFGTLAVFALALISPIAGLFLAIDSRRAATGRSSSR